MDPQLPSDVRGVAVLLRGMASQAPVNPGDIGPWDFLDRVAAGDKERLVRPALHELLGDTDAGVRRRAIEALTNLEVSADTLDRLLATSGNQVGDQLQHALSAYAFGSGRGREVSDAIVKLAGAQLPVVSAMTVIGRYDVTRSIELAKKHAAGSSDARAWTSLVMAVGMYHRDDLVALLRALSSLPEAAKREVLAEVERTLSASEAHFAGWAAQENFAAPQKAKPTLDECRGALGL